MRPDDRVMRADDWRVDLRYFADMLVRLHPNPFFAQPWPTFEQRLGRLLECVPELDGAQRLFALSKLVASLGDGHSYLQLMGKPAAMPLGYVPLRLYCFAEGLFVIGALPPHTDLIGRRVANIAGSDPDEVCRRLDPAVARDNPMTVRARIPSYIVLTQFIHAADLNRPGERNTWRFIDQAGATVVRQFAPVDDHSYWNWVAESSPLGRDGLPPTGDGPPYLRHLNQDFSHHYLADSRSLYIQYNAVTARTQSGLTMTDFAARLDRAISELTPARVIVDLRHNGGGDNRTYAPLLRALQAPAINRPGKLFAIIGRHTFSAAGNFATELERMSQAVFVGEPTGGGVNQYGDAEPLVLPRSQLVVRVSTRYHQVSDADDTRRWVEPAIVVDPTAATYFGGRDGAVEAILTARVT